MKRIGINFRYYPAAKLFVILSILFTVLFFFSVPIQAQEENAGLQEETVEATVLRVIEEKRIVPEGGTVPQLYQQLEAIITNGKQTGKKIIIESGTYPIANIPAYTVNDRVVITRTTDIEGKDIYYITDYVRRDALLMLFILFVAAVIIIGRWRGFMSLLGMALSFMVIFKFILPQISTGKDPIIVAIIGSIIMVPITFYFSHGLNKKTTIAIIGTLLSLVLTGVLANVFVDLAKLSGFSTEEANFLQTFYPGTINIRGLLLAGIIIGGLGIFDDVTISQAAIVAEIKKAAGRMHWHVLYKKAMNVGHDHIASMVNTLVLVYTGAAMPLLLLFINNPRPFAQIVNYEFMAEEIIRTLVASIGLICAVPITTAIAAIIFSRETTIQSDISRR